ncbi:hypothetical protein [Streptomyces sp. NBC_01237]|uniref:hypothetical protein n=1 Tax=Streptomyces sp. NBC_01237 TaxID=2903790 RepID=UPI002DD91ABB|nr:hypothetical protein [Streptomyces sp. NBC_01237]WRZ78718.1 hypothetical protein OG251_44645 [Streptomyces sp. NBC_01237]
MQHLKSPSRCTHCRNTWDYLRKLWEADVRGDEITIGMIASAVGIAPRTQRVHLSVMVRDGNVDVDRRTPLHPVVPAPAPPTTPGRWAATVKLTCDTCRRVLTVVAELAGADWTTRGITAAELARYAQMTPKTWGVHVGHLEEGKVLRREPDSFRADGGQWGGSRPDRYVLLSDSVFDELLTAGQQLPGARWFEDAAHELLTEVAPWAVGSKVVPSDRRALIRRVAGHMEYGRYPRDVLRRMIARRDIRPHHGITDAYALLISLLPPPTSTYTPSMGEVIGVIGRRALCLTCERPHDDARMPEGIMCDSCARALTPAF